MMDLVDTFTRHDHPRPPYRDVSGRSGAPRGEDDLDGLEEGMARMFAELRRGR